MPGVVKMVATNLDVWYVGLMRLLGVLHLLYAGAGWAITVACFKTGQGFAISGEGKPIRTVWTDFERWAWRQKFKKTSV